MKLIKACAKGVSKVCFRMVFNTEPLTSCEYLFMGNVGEISTRFFSNISSAQIGANIAVQILQIDLKTLRKSANADL